MEIEVVRVAEKELSDVLKFYEACGYTGGVQDDDATFKATNNNGTVGIGRLSWENDVMVLRGMYVMRGLHRKGIGQKLLATLDRSISNSECFCLAYDHLEKFYGKIGFKKITSMELPEFLKERFKKYLVNFPNIIPLRRATDYFKKSDNIKVPIASTLSKIQELWSLDPKVEFLRKVENYVYLSHRQKNKIAIRVTETNHRDMASLISELAWMDYLRKNDVPVVSPLNSIHGHLVETVKEIDRPLNVSAFHWAKGEPLQNVNDFTQNIFKNWGKVIGKMHHVSKAYIPPTGVNNRYDWDKDENLILAMSALNSSDETYTVFNECVEWMKGLPKDNDEYGLIHADLHHGNFFVDEENFTIFDFDDCCNHWFSYDIAVPFFSLKNFWENKKEVFEFEKYWEPFIEGYMEENNLSQVWVDRVTGFLRFRTAFIYYWCKARLRNNSFDKLTVERIEKFMDWCAKELEKPLKFI